MKLEISPEFCTCCEEWDRVVVHNHFDCPECGRKDAGTDCDDDLTEELPSKGQECNITLGCRECGAKFRLVNWDKGPDDVLYAEGWEWELVGKKGTSEKS